MLVKVVEVYPVNVPGNGQKYSLRETYINSEHVVCLREEQFFGAKIKNDDLLSELDDRQEYTKIYLNRGHTGLEFVVVGALATVQSKFNFEEKKNVLKG